MTTANSILENLVPNPNAGNSTAGGGGDKGKGVAGKEKKKDDGAFDQVVRDRYVMFFTPFDGCCLKIDF